MDPFDYLKHIEGAYDRSEALDALMQAYGKDVWSFAYSLTCKTEVADDITQSTFLQVFRKLHAFRGQSSIKTWILAIARNQAADYRRSAYLRRILLVPRVGGEARRKAASAEHEAMDRMAANDVWDVVLRLPEPFRAVLVLHVHHQLSVGKLPMC